MDDSVIVFGDYAYRLREDNTSEVAAYLGHDSFVRIPDEFDGHEVTSIGEDAFEKCYDITEIVFPETLQQIYANAFSGCCYIEELNLPESLHYIGDGAFSGCTFMSVTIPKNVIYIGNGAFMSCINIKEFIVAPENKNYVSVDGCIFDDRMRELVEYPSGKIGGYTVPDGIQKIGEYAFFETYHLWYINFPDSLTCIDRFAFSYCRDLRQVYIPDSVTEIKRGAFGGCSNLAKVRLSKNLKEIEETIFYETDVDNLIIPDGVTSIKEFSFNYCFLLYSIYIPESVTYIESDAFFNSRHVTFYGIENSYAQSYAESHNIPFVAIENYPSEPEDLLNTPDTPEPEILYGDINGDGLINTADAIEILRIAAGFQGYTDEQKIIADVNADNAVNTLDAIAVLRFVSGYRDDGILITE